MSSYIKYTYQFRPVLKRDDELDFAISNEDAEMAMSVKQITLSTLLNRDSIPISKKNIHFDNKICYNRDGKIILRVASNHTFSRAQNFQKQKLAHNPWNTIIIDNRPDIQSLYIEEVSESFKNTDVLATLLESSLNKLLIEYNLQLKINHVFESETFWEFTEKHRGQITSIDFIFSIPNLPRVSFEGDSQLRRIGFLTHGNRLHRIFADPGETLVLYKGLDPVLDEMVEAASTSGKPIVAHVKGIRKAFSIGVDKHCYVTFPNDIVAITCNTALFNDEQYDTLTILLDKYYD